jgi:oligopeptidase B
MTGSDELQADASLTPPQAPREPSARELHGDTVVDDYAWMRDRGDPRLRQYLEAERAYYDADSQRRRELAAALAAEASSRLPAGAEESVSWPQGGYLYRTRTPPDSDNLQLLRSPEDEPSEQLLLDENVVAAKSGFAEVGVR